MMLEDGGDSIACNGVGPSVFTDQEGTSFYMEYQAKDLSVKLGDCVRIKLETDGLENADNFAFGQVLAIYIDAERDFYIEVRWFLLPHELSSKHSKIITPQKNELIESTHMDDCPAGSVTEIIDIQGIDPNKRLNTGYFICRFMVNNQSSSLTKVSPHSILKRGMEISQYAYAYASHLEAQDGEYQTDPFSLAIQRLHISVIPDFLPCREEERGTVEAYLREGIKSNGSHRPSYICGMPGTGKTATVLATINALRKEVQSGQVPDFAFIEINCLRLKSPADAYTLLWRGLSGVHLPPKAAHKRLLAHFNSQELRVSSKSASDSAKSGIHAPGRVTICLVDELDYLLTRDFSVMYDFYSWPQTSSVPFIMIGIANTMDLPERLSTRLSSRADLGIRRLIFKPYIQPQILQILEGRLSELALPALNEAARKLISMKAASVAGDLRAALKICQRTIEMYRDEVLEREAAHKASHKIGSKRARDAETDVTAAAVVDGPVAVTHGEMIKFVSKAAAGYKETPFIAFTARACLLDKAILVIMGKYRHIVSGSEGTVSDAAMTIDDIWERFGDMMGKIDAERYLLAGQERSNTGNNTSNASNNTSTGVSQGLQGGTGSRVTDLHRPPYAIFAQAVQRLCTQGMVNRGTSWKVLSGPRSLLYSLHPNFTYSDLVAALKTDAMLKFCF